MYNYPFIRLIRAFLLSLFSEKVTVKDKTTISMRCSIGDIDPYWEMNNGRYQQLADIGRFNHGFRTPSSLFYFNSLFYLPVINYNLFHIGSLVYFGFSIFLLVNKILNGLKNNQIDYLYYYNLLDL